MSHQQIYKFFNNLQNFYNPDNISTTNDPVPYVLIDNFLPQDLYSNLIKEIKTIPSDYWTEFSKGTSYRKECRNLSEAPLLQSLSYSFQGSLFINWLEQITGIEKLIADPHLRGGGLCKVPTGYSLGLHNDFNWNDQIRLTRRVNLILYMNEEWQDDWGGDLEFWNFERTQCQVKIKPLPNRLAVWNYDERLIHGHPNPLTTPPGVDRQNLILFYYSSNATHETPPHRSQFI